MTIGQVAAQRVIERAYTVSILVHGIAQFVGLVEMPGRRPRPEL